MDVPKYKNGDRVLVDISIHVQKTHMVDEKLEGTIKSFEGFGMYLVKVDKLIEKGLFKGTYYFAENEIHPLEEEKITRSIEDLPVSEEKLEKFNLDMHFALIGWKIDNLLDKYNETGDKAYLKKCEEIMEV